MPSPARGLTHPQRVEMSNRRIVEAVAELVAEKCWEATTAAEVGRRAGNSRAMAHARDNLARELSYLRARLVREYGRKQRKEDRNAARHSRTRRST